MAQPEGLRTKWTVLAAMALRTSLRVVEPRKRMVVAEEVVVDTRAMLVKAAEEEVQF